MAALPTPTELAGIVVASALAVHFTSPVTTTPKTIPLPQWALELANNPQLQRISMREWSDPLYRKLKGWVGNDLCHNTNGNAVKILNYYWNPVTDELTGVVYFGSDCESHRGLCHGGSYTSLMDDFCGHIAFISGSSPWFGATVQVNVTLRKPIHIHQVLRVHGTKTTDGKKCKCTAVLDDGAGTATYCRLEGLSVTGLRLTCQDEHKDDDVANRVWQTNGAMKQDVDSTAAGNDEKEERAASLSVVRAVPFKSIGKVATLVVLGLIISRAIDVHVHGRV